MEAKRGILFALTKQPFSLGLASMEQIWRGSYRKCVQGSTFTWHVPTIPEHKKTGSLPHRLLVK